MFIVWTSHAIILISAAHISMSIVGHREVQICRGTYVIILNIQKLYFSFDRWVWMDGLRAASAGSSSGVLFDPSVRSLRGAESEAQTTAKRADLFIAWPFVQTTSHSSGLQWTSHLYPTAQLSSTHTETLWTAECKHYRKRFLMHTAGATLTDGPMWLLLLMLLLLLRLHLLALISPPPKH